MADYPPFMNAYGLIPKILGKIKEAKTPTHFTQDFLADTLGFPGGSAKAFIPFAKRLGLVGTDGTPTELYGRFRNANHSRGAMAQAIRMGYADLYERNENAHALDSKGLEGLVVQATGLDAGSATLRSIVKSFENLKALGDFGASPPTPPPPGGGKSQEGTKKAEKTHEHDAGDSSNPRHQASDLGLNLSYTINLVLPKTDDVAVFSAIFKALRENLLKQ
jgi:hypothetical protein